MQITATSPWILSEVIAHLYEGALRNTKGETREWGLQWWPKILVWGSARSSLKMRGRKCCISPATAIYCCSVTLKYVKMRLPPFADHDPPDTIVGWEMETPFPHPLPRCLRCLDPRAFVTYSWPLIVFWQIEHWEGRKGQYTHINWLTTYIYLVPMPTLTS